MRLAELSSSVLGAGAVLGGDLLRLVALALCCGDAELDFGVGGFVCILSA